MMKEARFLQTQEDHFRLADDLRFQWMTGNELVRRRERSLLEKVRALARPGARVLEVGCGEGANMFNAGLEGGLGMVVGLDFSVAKMLYWRNVLRTEPSVGSRCFGVGADAARISLRDESFDLVFCRDVIHHIPPRLQQAVVAEMVRVCRPGGAVLLIEANGRNPIIWAHGRFLPEESGELRVSPQFLRALVRQANSGSEPAIQMYEPLPLFRVLLHYRFGLPSLARRAWALGALDAVDGLAARLVPESRWAYCSVLAEKTRPQ